MADLQKLWDAAVNRAYERGWIRARMGKLESDGSYTIRVAGKPGWVHVRKGRDGKQGTTTARNLGAAERANMPVRMRQEGGEWVVYGADVHAVYFTGGDGYTGVVGPHDHRRGSGLEYEYEMEQLAAGRVYPEGGMVVYIAPFRYLKANGTPKTWLGGTIDLTSYQPATTGNWAWVLVGVDKSDNTAVAVKGTEYSYVTPLTIDLIDDISFSGYEPCTAIRVRADDTTLTDWRDYFDAHFWFGGGGGSSATAIMTDADGNAMTDADGNVMTES